MTVAGAPAIEPGRKSLVLAMRGPDLRMNTHFPPSPSTVFDNMANHFDQVNDFEGKSFCDTIIERKRLNTE